MAISQLCSFNYFLGSESRLKNTRTASATSAIRISPVFWEELNSGQSSSAKCGVRNLGIPSQALCKLHATVTQNLKLVDSFTWPILIFLSLFQTNSHMNLKDRDIEHFWQTRHESKGLRHKNLEKMACTKCFACIYWKCDDSPLYKVHDFPKCGWVEAIHFNFSAALWQQALAEVRA